MMLKIYPSPASAKSSEQWILGVYDNNDYKLKIDFIYFLELKVHNTVQSLCVPTLYNVSFYVTSFGGKSNLIF